MIVVTADGRAVQDDRAPELETLQEICDTSMACVIPRIHAFCDEDATFKAKGFNPTASNWLQYSVYGTVVFLTDEEWKIFCKDA